MKTIKPESAMETAQARPSSLMTLADFRQLMQAQHPFFQMLDLQVESIGFGQAVIRLPARDRHQRLGGIVAGPMLMGLADVAMYAAVVGATGQAHAVTASLTINFMRPSAGGDVLAYASLMKIGRLCTGEVTLMVEGAAEPAAHVVSVWSVPNRG